MTEAVVNGGQAQADSTGTTAAAPVQTNGSGGQVQTTESGSAAQADESFFDPRSIQDKPELQTAYKQMQGEFTKRMQSMRKDQMKIDTYGKFERDPIGTMQQFAAQMGYQLVQRDKEQPKDWTPQSWDDVKQHFFQEFQKEKLDPLVSEVRSLKKQSIEQQLDAKFPDWRTYEDAMMDKLRLHPTLVEDPDTLYRMSVPQNIWEARATKAAIEKLKGATDNAQISGGATAKQTSSQPTGKLTFAQSIEYAKAQLKQKGVRAPH